MNKDNKTLRELIKKILFENYEDWSDFDQNEFEGEAMKTAKEDIEASGEKFVPLGKSKFEKKLDINALIKDLEASKYKKTGKDLEKTQKQIDHLKKFGKGSLNEKEKLKEILRIKDKEGNPITLNVRVEDVETQNIGRVVRFGVNDFGELTVHVSWVSNFGKEIPKSITYPNKIVVRDKSKMVKENNEFEVKQYIVKVKSDKGVKKIKTSGTSENVAKEKIMNYEKCPQSAILSIEEIPNKIVKEDIIRYFLETYIDGKQMLGSDGTLVVHNPSKVKKYVINQIKRLKNLKEKVKTYIGKSEKIELKLTDNKHETLKTFDVTKEILEK